MISTSSSSGSGPVVALGRAARLTRQEHEAIGRRLRAQRRVKAAAEADARCRALGHLAVIAFTVLGIAMSQYAIYVDHNQQQRLDAEVAR